MAGKKYPVRMDMNEIRKNTAGKDKAARGAKELQRGAVARGNREQAREAGELKTMNMRKKKLACGGKTHKYAKGGKIDGCCVKGKTKGKMY